MEREGDENEREMGGKGNDVQGVGVGEGATTQVKRAGEQAGQLVG